MQKKKTIILVDDNIINLTIGKRTLSEQYELLTAPSGEKLFQALESIRPDMILLDIDMPDMNGYQTLKLLKEYPRTAAIPVIFLSARDDADSFEKGFELGAVDFATKPYTPKLLINLIERHFLIQAQQEALSNQEIILSNLVNAKKHSTMELQNAILSTLVNLAESRGNLPLSELFSSGNTIQHSLSALVAEMMTESAYKQEITEWDADLFMASAQLHDIGKISIKDRILLKPGRLTSLEFDQMKKHTVFGVQLIETIERNTTQWNFFANAKLFAGSHHERWDGSGYPLGLHGENIPLHGRLMAIIDVYNALVSNRPYKQPISPQAAKDIIARGQGTLFDPALTEIFLSVADASQ